MLYLAARLVQAKNVEGAFDFGLHLSAFFLCHFQPHNGFGLAKK